MAVEHWFPTSIYFEDLEPSDDVRKGMYDYVKKYDDEWICPDCNDPSCDRKRGNFTGDTSGDYKITNKKPFYWLNYQVKKHCKIYLRDAYGVDTDKIDLFVSKSWPVVCGTDGGRVDNHNHINSHLSIVYYLQYDSESKGGDLRIGIPTGNPIEYLPIGAYRVDKKEIPFSGQKNVWYRPIENRLLIFPSSLNHEVESYKGDVPRYSITYDIIITGKADSDEFDNEMSIIHPTQWGLL